MPDRDIFSFNVCSQCLEPFTCSASRDVRHAIPCGHVFCKACLDAVETEQRFGKSICRRAGCGRELDSAAEFPISWIPQRAERINAAHNEIFGDQGNVGERPPPACSMCGPDTATGEPHLATHRCKTCGYGVYFCAHAASLHPKLEASIGHVVSALPARSVSSEGKAGENDARWSLCPEHNLRFDAAEASTHRPMCAECLTEVEGKVAVQTLAEALAGLHSAEAAAALAELTKQRNRFAEPTFTPDELRDSVMRWGAEETARIRAWEEREVKHVQAVAVESEQLLHSVANDTARLVHEVCERRIEVGASLITQRMGLRASLDEFDRARADLPRDPAAQLSKTRAVYAERKRLCELLARYEIAVPSARVLIEWAQLPALAGQFDRPIGDGMSAVTTTVQAAAKSTLEQVRARIPELEPELSEGLHDFPAFPRMVSVPQRAATGRLSQCIFMSNLLSNYVGSSASSRYAALPLSESRIRVISLSPRTDCSHTSAPNPDACEAKCPCRAGR